jgi:hypothetical protein
LECKQQRELKQQQAKQGTTTIAGSPATAGTQVTAGTLWTIPAAANMKPAIRMAGTSNSRDLVQWQQGHRQQQGRQQQRMSNEIACFSSIDFVGSIGIWLLEKPNVAIPKF